MRYGLRSVVSIGTLYEYFPNKQALLFALAERHIELAEAEIGAACKTQGPLRELLAALQQAILACQRFPSQALDLVEREESGNVLRERAVALKKSVLQTLQARAAHLSDPALRARAAFGAIGELSARMLYELDDSEAQARLSRYLLDMALVALQSPAHGDSPLQLTDAQKAPESPSNL